MISLLQRYGGVLSGPANEDVFAQEALAELQRVLAVFVPREADAIVANADKTKASSTSEATDTKTATSTTISTDVGTTTSTATSTTSTNTSTTTSRCWWERCGSSRAAL